jgi:hypothetical protein
VPWCPRSGRRTGRHVPAQAPKRLDQDRHATHLPGWNRCISNRQWRRGHAGVEECVDQRRNLGPGQLHSVPASGRAKVTPNPCIQRACLRQAAYFTRQASNTAYGGVTMESKSVADSWERGNPYEDYVGRWSRRVAPAFLSWLNIPSGRRWRGPRRAVAPRSGVRSTREGDRTDEEAVQRVGSLGGSQGVALLTPARRAAVRAGSARGSTAAPWPHSRSALGLRGSRRRTRGPAARCRSSTAPPSRRRSSRPCR